MSTSKRGYQFGSPVLVPSLGAQASAQSLRRLKLVTKEDGGNGYDEAWLQRLLQRNPLMLPLPELEPGLGEPIPVAIELPTPAGYLDNLFVTPEGNLILVECKLWRNPEARRRVIAQIIDYAQSVATWSYEQLDAAVRKCAGFDQATSGRGLLEIVRGVSAESNEIDEAEFIDAVQRNLRLGRMLLLVVGDGIREDTESLTDFLQQHAGFHFTLALVETAVFELPSSGFIIQSRVLARTLNIERAVVSLIDGKLSVGAVTTSVMGKSAAARSLSEDAFFDRLKANEPETADALAAFSAKASDVSVFLDVATKTAVLKWVSPAGRSYSLGGIDIEGRLVTYSVCLGPKPIGRLDLAHEYLRSLGKLIGAQVRQTPSADQWYLVTTGTIMPAAKTALTAQADNWISLIADYQRKIGEAESQFE